MNLDTQIALLVLSFFIGVFILNYVAYRILKQSYKFRFSVPNAYIYGTKKDLVAKKRERKHKRKTRLYRPTRKRASRTRRKPKRTNRKPNDSGT